MEFIENKVGTEYDIKIKGRFTFVDHLSFRNVITSVSEGKATRISLDFAEVDFIDSAALGILLLLRDECNKHNTSLALCRPNGQVKKMFEISKFYELFSVMN